MRPIFMLILINTWLLLPAIGLGQADPLAPKGKVKKPADPTTLLQKSGTTRIGEIIVVGAKSDDAIRKAAGLFPGQVLDGVAIQKAEKSLAAFDATVMVMDTTNPGFKDILIKVKNKLDQQITEALKNNPDIRVAEAKVRESEAELNRTRMKVISDVTFLQAEIHAAQAMVDYAKKKYDRMSALQKAGSIEESVYGESALALEKAKADLAAKQAKLPYLLGKQPGSIDARIEATNRVNIWYDLNTAWDEAHAASPRDLVQYLSVGKTAVQALADIGSPMTDKLRKALDTPMTFPRAEVDLLTDLMEFVRDKGLDFNIIIRLKSTKKMRLNIQLEKPIPLGAFLQYLEDELGVVFVLRDYGIVVTAADERLPPGAIRVVDFWKHGGKAETKQDTKEKK